MTKGKFSRHGGNDGRNVGTLRKRKEPKPVFYFAAYLEGKGP